MANKKLESITYEDVNAAKARIKVNQEKLDELINENSHMRDKKRVVPYWLTSKWIVPKNMQQFKISEAHDSDYNIVWEMVKKRDGTPIKYGPYELLYIADTAFVKFPSGNFYPIFSNVITDGYNKTLNGNTLARMAYDEFCKRNNLVVNQSIGIKNKELYGFMQTFMTYMGNQAGVVVDISPPIFIANIINLHKDSGFFSFFKDFIIEVSKDREAVLNKRKALMAKISADNNIIKAYQEGVENYQEYLDKKKEKRQEKIEKKLAARSKEEVERLTKLALLIAKFKPIMDEIEEGIGNSEYVFNFGNFPHRMRHIENGLKHLEYLTSSVKNNK